MVREGFLNHEQIAWQDPADARRVFIVNETGDPVTFGQSINIAVKTTAITVGTTAVALPTTALANRKVIVIFNDGAQNLFIGDSSVTTSNGYLVPRNTSIAFDITANVAIYGLVSTGTTTVRIIEGS